MSNGSTELAERILHGREERNLEYKSAGNWSENKFKIIKCALGMSNIRDGGLIIIGVREEDEEYQPEGLSYEQRRTYKQDTIARAINKYADPFVEVVVNAQTIEVEDGTERKFVVIRVEEFNEFPVVCKKHCEVNGHIFMREGAIYTRPFRMVETIEVPSHLEMREIIESATDKSMRAFLTRNRRVGIFLGQAPTTEPSAEQHYDEQLGDL